MDYNLKNNEFKGKTGNGEYFTLEKCTNLLLILYSLLFVLFHSAIGASFITFFERADVLVGGLLILCSAAKFVKCKEERQSLKIRPFLLIFIYLAIRAACWISVGFEYSTIRTIFFEFVYLVALNEMIVSEKLLKNFILPMIIIVNFVLNVINTIYAVSVYFFPQGLLTNKFLPKENIQYWQYFTIMYDNSNTMGIMAGFSLIAFFVIKKNFDFRKYKLIAVIYVIFTLSVLYYSQCRSAQLAVIVTLVAFVVVKYFNFINKRGLTVAILILSVFFSGIIFGVMTLNKNTGLEFSWKNNYTELEKVLQDKSSGRYNLWKSGLLASKNYNLVLGAGSAKQELDARNKYVLGLVYDYYGNIDGYPVEERGPHSGFFGMIYITGFAGALVFMSILIYMMLNCDLMKRDHWYLLIIFSTIINNFETSFITGRYFICLLIILILSSKGKDVLSSEDGVF